MDGGKLCGTQKMDPSQTDKARGAVRCLELLPVPSGTLQNNFLPVPEPSLATVTLTFSLQT